MCADMGEAEAFLDAMCICIPPLTALQSAVSSEALLQTGRDPSSIQVTLGDSVHQMKLLRKLVSVLP